MPRDTLDQRRSTARNAYWLLLTVVTGAIVVIRRSTIWPGTLGALDQGLLVFLAFLLILPLVGEFEAFGFRVKRQIEQATATLSNRMDVLHAAFQTSIGVRSDVNVNVPLIAPEQLQRLEEAIRRERAPCANNE